MISEGDHFDQKLLRTSVAILYGHILLQFSIQVNQLCLIQCTICFHVLPHLHGIDGLQILFVAKYCILLFPERVQSSPQPQNTVS